MGFSDPNEVAGGSPYFKPKEYMNALALLIEPKRIERNVPNTYRGKTRERDEVTADISVFDKQNALENREPTTVLKNAKVTHGMLVGTLEKIIEGASVFIVDTTQTENGEGYVFRPPESDALEAAKAYYEERESALDNAPDF